MTALDPMVPTWGPVRRTTVLVVAGCAEDRAMLTSMLAEGGYDVAAATDAGEALRRVDRDDPDVVLLTMAPCGPDTLALCRRLRERSDAYVVIVGDRDHEADTLAGLAAGADEYATASCSPRELMARVHVLTRRTRRRSGRRAARARAPRRHGALLLDPAGREVTVAGHRVQLTRLEFDLLATLVDQPDVVFSRRMLLDRVWGPTWSGDDHVVDVHIANLRKKIDVADHRHITTVRGVGYRLS